MLISAQNLAEALTAAAHELVSIVDLKKPTAGSLGFAGSETINVIVRAVKRKYPAKALSIACGELTQWGQGRGEAEFSQADIEAIDWTQIQFVKVGLSGQWSHDRLIARLKQFYALVPTHVRRVMVIYVDICSTAQAIELIQRAPDVAASVVLLDTFDKTAGDTFDWYTPADCQSLFNQARSMGMCSVLAGSIDQTHFSDVASSGADLIGVRGAVCEKGSVAGSMRRKNQLCPTRLDQFLVAAKMTLVEVNGLS